ncbi:hypothetical protein LTR37_007559 [Vermiconidia calcicola]|uniref:Uncharacterized protein n=1 Tax=Vermiconidia calcicola TaxID=1690605 RepID=A0ACC3NDJ9_9PEZI|nr:hypothetical protein LTR37_007559 [Vermiconidia calcicola]
MSPFLTQLIPAGNCACHSSTTFECSSCVKPQSAALEHNAFPGWEYQYGRDDKNLGLAEDQCAVAFPGLFEDLHRALDYWTQVGKFTSATLDSYGVVHGVTKAIIYDGQLYVLATKSKAQDHRRKVIATLSSIHRAIAAFPDRHSLPNIEFLFSIEDKAEDVASDGLPIWVLARKAREESVWLMPDFGFGVWDNIIDDSNNEIGPYDEVVEKAMEVEEGLSFDDKQPKLVWRGKLSFAPKLRRALLDQSRGQDCSDVKELNWDAKQNYLPLETTASTSLLHTSKACRSVLVLHALQYIQHHHYLLVSSGPLQNYVEVKRDFSDLSAKMSNMLDHPAKAEKIADNSVKTFRERYLTPAAEACYWRALWRAYAQASEPADPWRLEADGTRTKRGLRYEMFLLMSSEDMLDFAVR